MKIKQYLQNAWSWYLSRKLWQRIVIGLIFLSIITSPFNKSEDTSSLSTKQTTTETSKSPEPQKSETTSATPTSVPMSPVQFRVEALGDLRDMRKDVADLKRTLAEGGRIRLITNSLELSFNLGQLQSLNPPDQILIKWSEYLTALDDAVTAFSDGISEDTTSQSNRKLDAILSKIANAENFVKSVS